MNKSRALRKTNFIVLLFMIFMLSACSDMEPDRTKNSLGNIVILISEDFLEIDFCNAYNHLFYVHGDYKCDGENGYYQQLTERLSDVNIENRSEVDIE